MSNLFAELTNLFDQDFMSVENGKSILDWLNKHKEDINNIEKFYLDDFEKFKQQLAQKEKEMESILTADDIWFDSYQYSVDVLKNELKGIKQNQTQLVINELGETRKRINALMYQENKCLNKEDCITDCLEVIDKQIKMLKKEI